MRIVFLLFFFVVEEEEEEEDKEADDGDVEERGGGDSGTTWSGEDICVMVDGGKIVCCAYGHICLVWVKKD